MAMRPTVEAVNLIIQRWSPELILLANEEMVIGKYFRDGTKGAQVINGQLNFRTIAALVASSTNYATGATLTYNSNTEAVVNATPTFIYAGVQLPLSTLTRMKNDVDLQKAYKAQAVAALQTSIDVGAAGQASNAGTTTGGATASVSKDLLTSSIGALVTSAKNKVQWGKTPLHIVIHPSQVKYTLQIQELMNANLRGDAANPNVSGVVLNGWGCTFAESGNIAVSAGNVASNMLYTDDTFAIAYNQEPEMLPIQDIEAYYNLIAIAEYGVTTLVANYGVQMQTSIT